MLQDYNFLQLRRLREAVDRGYDATAQTFYSAKFGISHFTFNDQYGWDILSLFPGQLIDMNWYSLWDRFTLYIEQKWISTKFWVTKNDYAYYLQNACIQILHYVSTGF